MIISVLGGGPVGLVSAACFAKIGHHVTLVETEREKVKSINSGRPPFFEPGLKDLLDKHLGHNLFATTDCESISTAEVVFICVGTPRLSDGGVDLCAIESASRIIGNAFKSAECYKIVAAKSTVPPGTMNGLIMPIVLRQSRKSAEEIGFVSNPEFLREGQSVQDFLHPDRIVIGSFDKRAGDLVEAIYTGIEAPIVRTDTTTAEMIKYASNAFLATKISYANEMGNISKKLGIDVYEVMHGVGLDHRISPHFLSAGLGFGGSCLRKDLRALICLAEKLSEDPLMLKAAQEVNERQPLRLVEQLERKIGVLRDKRIAVLGLAFKDNTDDVRESRAIPVIRALKEKGAVISAYDPQANAPMKCLFPEIEYCKSAAEALINADACLLLTEWPEFRYLTEEFDLMRSRVILEGRRILNCSEKEGICW